MYGAFTNANMSIPAFKLRGFRYEICCANCITSRGGIHDGKLPVNILHVVDR